MVWHLIVPTMAVHLAEMRGCSQRTEEVHWCDRCKKGAKSKVTTYTVILRLFVPSVSAGSSPGHKSADTLKMKMVSRQTPTLTGQSAVDTCVQTFARLCPASQRVQCGYLPLPGRRPGPGFHGERTRNLLHHSYTTIYCGCKYLISIFRGPGNAAWTRSIRSR